MGYTLGEQVLVYWPVGMALGVISIGALFDTERAEVEGAWPPPILSSPNMDYLTSPFLWGPVVVAIALLYKSESVARKHNVEAWEHASMVWASCNVTIYHTLCDLFSGFFQVLPGMRESYYLLNKDHRLPRHHPTRMVMDVIYWLEILEVVIALYVLYLFWNRRPHRYVVESWLHGMHLGGYMAYYLPGIYLGHYTSFITNLDRCIALCWVFFPIALVHRAINQTILAVEGGGKSRPGSVKAKAN
eukprot:Hpha_TRINITY_DN15915_c5_g6::TRINITY_DN15915_c5_g6_i1::g.73269::m.73269